jgi:MFS family permease
MTNMVKTLSDEDMLQGTPQTSAIQRVAARQSGVWVLLATILGSSMAFIDGTVVNVALPVLQLDLKATAADVQWVVEAYAPFLAALILVGGSLGDHFGRRRIFAIGVSLFAVASVLCGLAPTIVLLIVARAMQGMGGALLVPASLALISAAFEGQQRGRAIGTWSGFTAMTSVIGPVLGGWLVASARLSLGLFYQCADSSDGAQCALLARHGKSWRRGRSHRVGLVGSIPGNPWSRRYGVWIDRIGEPWCGSSAGTHCPGDGRRCAAPVSAGGSAQPCADAATQPVPLAHL